MNGLEALRDAVRCLRETGRYVDEEGEATNALADLSDALHMQAQEARAWKPLDAPSVLETIDRALLELAAKNGNAAAQEKLADGVRVEDGGRDAGK